MSKKPDVKGIAGKFSLSKIMNNIAEVVDSNSKISDVDPSDSIGKKIQDIDNTVQEMHQSQQEHTNNLARVDQLLKDLYQDLQEVAQHHLVGLPKLLPNMLCDATCRMSTRRM